MGQSKPYRATALVVEDDPTQREMLCLLLEESEIDVIECESAEAAELVLEQADASLVLLMTDVNLAGHMNGVELAHVAKKYNPELDVIVTSGTPLRQALPDGAQILVQALGAARRDPRGGADVAGLEPGRRGVAEPGAGRFRGAPSALRRAMIWPADPAFALPGTCR